MTILPLLDKLTRGPLKPQQRLFALKVFTLPKCYVMALGRVNAGELNRMNKNVRVAVQVQKKLEVSTCFWRLLDVVAA